MNGEQFTLTGEQGTAEVTLTVVEDEPGYEGLYHWHYVVENVSYGEPGATPSWMEYSVDASAVGDADNLQSSLGWEGMVVADPEGSGLIVWDMGDQSPLGVGQTAEFSFTTSPMPVGEGLGTLVDNNPVGDSAAGELLAPSKGAKVDFANATTGQDYRIQIKGYAGGPQPSEQGTAVITKNATAEDIADTVKIVLEGIGYKVRREGTKLTIAPPAANRNSLWFQTQKPNGQDDNTFKGPSLISLWPPNYTVYVNGEKQNP